LAIREKIYILLIKNNKMKVTALARKLNVNDQTLRRKINKDKLKNCELVKIAKALKCSVEFTEPVFIIKETGERV